MFYKISANKMRKVSRRYVSILSVAWLTFRYSFKCSRSVLSNMAVTCYMWLFKCNFFKIKHIKKKKISSSVALALATFQVLSSHMCLVRLCFMVQNRTYPSSHKFYCKALIWIYRIWRLTGFFKSTVPFYEITTHVSHWFSGWLY